jgi:hypothetical protein
MILGGAMFIGGVMSNVFSSLHHIHIPCSKGERLFHRKIKGIQIGGAAPRRVQARGASLRGEWPFDIDVKGGDIITLM